MDRAQTAINTEKAEPLAGPASAGDGALLAARVDALYRASRLAHLATPAGAGMLLLLLWGPITGGVLFAWFVIVVVVSLGRLGLYRAYLASARTGEQAAAWERRFALGSFASGACWTFPVQALFPDGAAILQTALMFVVGGTIIGSAAVHGASRLSFYSFAALPILTVAVQLGVQPDPICKLLAATVLLFGAAMMKVHGDVNRSVVENLGGRLRLDNLLGQLSESDALLRDAIEHCPGGFVLWDEYGKLSLCNASFAALYGAGRSANEMAGMTFSDVAENACRVEQAPVEFAGNRAAWIQANVERQALADGGLHQFQLRDGRWMRAKAAQAARGAVVGIVDDISELKRAQDSYLELIVQEDLTLETLPVGVMFLERGTIVRCNGRLEAMLGYEAGELRGKSARVLFRSESAWHTVRREALRRLATGSGVEGAVQLARKDGSTLWCRSNGRGTAADDRLSGIFTYSDAEEQRAGESAVRESERMYRNLVETSNDLIWRIDAAMRWTYVNSATVQRIYGRHAPDLLGRPLTEFSVEAVSGRDHAVMQRVLGGESVFEYETRHRRGDGSTVDLSLNAVPLRDAHGAIVGATGTARDVTEQKRASARLYENIEKLRLAVDAADLVYWEWDRVSDGAKEGLNSFGEFAAPPGIPKIDGQSWSVHPDDCESERLARETAMELHRAFETEFRIRAANGEVRWIASRGRPLMNPAGAAYRMIGVSQDITERKHREDEARFMAYHDVLTGLPNRRLFDDRLRQAVFAAGRQEASLAVIAIDLDNFKKVNDTLGHKAGDAVLRDVAVRLSACLRRSDTLARHGGDEFVVLAPDLKGPGDVELIAAKLLGALGSAFPVEGRVFDVGASLGVSIYPADALDGEALMRNADAAMYRAKELGKNNVRFYGR